MVGTPCRPESFRGSAQRAGPTNMSKIDKAVILAAGRGTRMRELTADLPKPMIEVRGKPVLQHIVEGLRDTGVRNFLVIVVIGQTRCKISSGTVPATGSTSNTRRKLRKMGPVALSTW